MHTLYSSTMLDEGSARRTRDARAWYLRRSAVWSQAGGGPEPHDAFHLAGRCSPTTSDRCYKLGLTLRAEHDEPLHTISAHRARAGGDRPVHGAWLGRHERAPHGGRRTGFCAVRTRDCDGIVTAMTVDTAAAVLQMISAIARTNAIIHTTHNAWAVDDDLTYMLDNDDRSHSRCVPSEI
jgi:hypothetical protein